ncbi:MAG: hypothetical protein ACK58T_05165, partial [Phycisphaerae bacterium]
MNLFPGNIESPIRHAAVLIGKIRQSDHQLQVVLRRTQFRVPELTFPAVLNIQILIQSRFNGRRDPQSQSS